MVSGRVSPEAGKGLVAPSVVSLTAFSPASSGDVAGEVLLMGVSLRECRGMPGKRSGCLERVRGGRVDQPASAGGCSAGACCSVGVWDGAGAAVSEGAGLGPAVLCPARAFCTQAS